MEMLCHVMEQKIKRLWEISIINHGMNYGIVWKPRMSEKKYVVVIEIVG